MPLSPLLLWLAACTDESVILRVVDEGGGPVADARFAIAGASVTTDADGEARFSLERGALGLVEKEGYLTEPVPIGRQSEGQVVEVRMLAEEGRIVLHNTGDVMMGRRYVTPDEGDALLSAYDPSLAEALVSDVADAVAAADMVSVNLETVVGTLLDDEAYPGKRWLLQTPPAALAALPALGVEAVGLANNHQRDWLELGIESTLAALADAGLAHVGGGMDEAQATEPVWMDVGGQRVAMLAYTSVDGTYVNDQYPTDDEPLPDEVPDEDAFKWEARSWGAESLGIPVAARRIGGAWAAVDAVIDALPEADQAMLWSSVTEVWPELQDWVARRGHGGGALWTDDAPTRIAAARAEADLVVVQLHMGFQFASAPGEYTVEAARAAVDAGADLVVCHHPHVLQGFEVYNGKVIAYSLGNFLFDQDFLSTFGSAWLRTVWEGDTLVEGRVVPTMLDAYRPVPVVDHLAYDIGRTLWEASLLDATALRGEDLAVRTVAGSSGRGFAGMRIEHGTFVLTDTLPDPRVTSFDVPADADAPVRLPGLVDRQVGEGVPEGLEVGRSLIKYGRFEDEDGDTTGDETQGWTWTSEDIVLDDERPLRDTASMKLYRDAGNESRVSARMIARIPLPDHRLYGDAEGEVTLDGDCSYSVRLRSRYEGSAPSLSVRVAVYHFDDLNPTEDPESVLLREVELPVDLHPGASQDYRIALDAEHLAPVDGLRANAVLLYLSLSPPESEASTVWVDDLDLIEWRSASAEPEGWGAIDWLRHPDGAQGVPVRWLSWEE